MPSDKTILNCMPLGDLQAVARKLDVNVVDRRRKDALVSGLLKAKDHTLSTVLAGMTAPALKAACEALELEDVGRGKAACLEALLAVAPQKKAKALAAKKATAVKKATAKAAAAPVARKAKSKAEPKAKAKAKTKTAPKPAALGAGHVKTAAQDPAAVSEPAEAAQPAAPEPAKKAPAAKRGPLSWSEAAQMAAHRGQSAQTMLRPPVPQASGQTQHTCAKCHAKVTVQACQVQACNNYYVAAPNRKICSECLFERNTISMDEFNDRLHEERLCTHCGVPMTHLASGGNA